MVLFFAGGKVPVKRGFGTALTDLVNFSQWIQWFEVKNHSRER
jgi:hypothetical protein